MAARYEDFVSSEHRQLLRYATALCGNQDDAFDLVQDVLTKLFEDWSRIGRLENPGGYATRMVTNAFLSWRRRWATRSVRAVEADTLERLGEPADDHSRQLGDRDDLERRLAGLPARQRAALVLRYLEGYDHAEIADILGCALGTARSAVSRGLANLRLDDGTDAPADAPVGARTHHLSIPRRVTTIRRSTP